LAVEAVTIEHGSGRFPDKLKSIPDAGLRGNETSIFYQTEIIFEYDESLNLCEIRKGASRYRLTPSVL
jgi:hypothetical protein